MKVILCAHVLEGLLEAARRNYPNEFFCLLGGEKTGDAYLAREIVYIPFRSGPTYAFFQPTDIPFDSSIIGSAHTHPGPALPSSADLHSFPYAGWVHVIISYPYTAENVRAYDAKGNEISWTVAECGQ